MLSTAICRCSTAVHRPSKTNFSISFITNRFVSNYVNCDKAINM